MDELELELMPDLPDEADLVWTPGLEGGRTGLEGSAEDPQLAPGQLELFEDVAESVK